MKTLLITILNLFLLTTMAYADKLVVINPGSEEGVFRQILTDITENIEHDFIQANNPIVAASYIDKDVLTIWSSEWPSNNDIQSPIITEDNLIALMTYETMICSRKFKSLEEMANKQVKIATWGSQPVARFLKKLSQTYAIDFIIVPYDGSGSTTKGYIAGDADTIFTVTSRQKAIEESDNTFCFAFSHNNDLDFRFVDAIIGVNMSTENFNLVKTSLENKINSTDWNEKFAGANFYVNNKDDNLVNIFSIAVENFSN